MADAAVEFMLENLKQLLLHYSHLISDAKGQVEKLETDLRFFKGFLKDASTKRRRKDEAMRQIVRDIRSVVYEAEDIIDSFVTQATEIKSKPYFLRAFITPNKLLDIAQQVEAVCKKISDIKGGKDNFDIANLAIKDGEAEEHQVTKVREENVVGFEDATAEIIGYLKEDTQELDVISIIGMPGLGKTTVAGKIFRDPEIQYEFPTRIWVNVSQEFTEKDIFLDILRQMMTQLNKDLYEKSADELAKEVIARLEGGKFLIVMDDVWTADDWARIRVAMPKTGKVMITSRHVEVANFANYRRPAHLLRFLTQEESWTLLQLEVFGEPKCPDELDLLGQAITCQCDGLPLAIVVIGGILARKFFPSNMVATRNAWTKVSESVPTTIQEEDPKRRMENIISLSYIKLPYHLRDCFLYLGMFPEDYEISAWKLIRMWIAEGLVQQKDSTSLEQTAESYLDELINRNLVRIDQRKADGKVKTCRIHDMLRDFCRNEAAENGENFLKEIKKSIDGGFKPSTSEIHKYRRLCIHSNVMSFLSTKQLYGPHVRSFVSFDKDEFNLPNENISSIPAAFKLLRVLEAKPIKFTKLPSDLYSLIHLRYITLTFNSEANAKKPAMLPAAFSKLWNLETFVVYTSSRILEVKADILNMIQLRHFKTNTSAILAKPSKKVKEGERLQTLGTISPKSCTEEVFDRARNLKKLGIRGKLALLLDGKSNDYSFDSLRKLGGLENLKLLNDVFPEPPSEGRLPGLPPPYKFPAKLRSLTLFDTSLEWTEISKLALLENLVVLKLKDNAFTGETWKVADNVIFRCLEVLQIGRTNLTLWVASGGNFPKLQHLQLQNCENLQQLPKGLADIPDLQLLELYRTKHAVASARKIHEEKKKNQPSTTYAVGQFKLTIFPLE